MLQVGEDFIWAEFTKTSLVDEWTEAGPIRPPRQGTLVEFLPRKMNKSLADYVHSAQKGHPVFQEGMSHQGLQNAIPRAIGRAEQKAASAKRSAGSAKRRVVLLTTVGFLGIALGVFGAFATLVSQLSSTRTAMQSTVTLAGTTNSKVEEQARKVQELNWRLKSMEDQLRAVSRGAASPELGQKNPRCAKADAEERHRLGC